MFTKNLSTSNIVTIEDDVIDTAVTIADEKGAIGAVNFKRFGTLHIFHTGEDAKGKTPIVLDGPEEVFGFLNALVDVIDHPEMFSVLNTRVHKYANLRDFGEAAGYVLDVITTPDGLDLNRITSLKRANGADAYDAVINPVPYSVSNQWAKKENREANRIAHAIVNRHLGINYVLNILAGTHSVSFKAYKFSEKLASALNDKIRGLFMDASFRDNVKADKSLAHSLKVEAGILEDAFESGKLSVEPVKATVSAYWYQDMFLTRVDCTLNDMIGKTFFMVREGGSRLPFRSTVNRMEQAIVLWKQAIDNNCYLSETE